MLLNVDDYRRAARRRLPRVVFDAIAGGAGDEVTLARNERAFDDLALRPRSLADISVRDLSTTVLGTPVTLPVLLAPCGLTRMAHRDAELAVACAAAEAGTVYVVSTVTSSPLEEISAATGSVTWFQLYPPDDREACRDLLARARGAGYQALVVTIDTGMFGLRERDKRNRLVVPIELTARLALQGATRPRWALDFLRGGAGAGHLGFPPGGTTPRMWVKEAGAALAATAKPVSLDDMRFIREHWDGPLVIKGVQRGDECRELVDELDLAGIVVSNHGGRQLDTGLATIEILPEVVAAVGDDVEVFLDGGIRRGTDVLKAIALGARAVLVGRPYVYGLAVDGQAGVRGVLDVLRAEIDGGLGLLGCGSLAALDESAVLRRPGFATSHQPAGAPHVPT